MRYILALTFILAALWLAVSGVYKPLILLLGAGSIALVVWLALRMEVVGEEHNPVIYSWRLPLYWAWLMWQIVRANLNVARLILSPRDIRPRVVTIPTPHHSTVARVTYANSVTLTPGTVSLLLTKQELTVHALDTRSVEELEEGTLARRIAWLEGSDMEHP